MKFEPSWKVVLAVLVIGATALFLQRSGWAAYGLDRVRFGTDVTVAGTCHKIPSGWTVLPQVGASDDADLRLHFVDGAPVFASVVNGSGLRDRALSAPRVGGQTANGYAVHDIGAFMSATSARFVALKEGSAVAFIGDREASVRDLAQRLAPCS
jgi:hypothetical protein